LFDEDGRPAVASARMIETLAFYRELARYTPPAPVTPRSRDFFLQGRVAMMFYSTFIMDDLAIASVAADSLTGKHFPDLDGASFDVGLIDKVRMTPVLTRRQPISYGSINAIGVAAGLDESTRALALDFLGFLFRPDIYITWLHMAPGGMMPVLRDIAQGDDFFRDPSGVFQRYGRARIVAIIAGLEKLSSFGRAGDRFNPYASRALADGIVARMVHRTVIGEAPRHAAAQAEVEMRERMRDR
jgi:multiple sugar transport system substrate-binding protein